MVKRYEVIVEIHFFDHDIASVLAQYLRGDAVKKDVEGLVFELQLYFEDANKAKKYLEWKAKKTAEAWAGVR